MIEHSCCCIWDFVMCGLNQIQFGFENPLKIGFEKFEKEKRERKIFIFGPQSSRSPVLGLQRRPTPSSPAPASGFLGPSPSRGLLDRLHARGRVPHRVADMLVPPVSIRLPFLSSSSGSFQPRALPSSPSLIW
jgi:hypothetical protein